MPEHRFTIGICATDDSVNMARLLDLVSSDAIPEDCRITDVVVVVSGSSDGTDEIARTFTTSLNLTVITEKARKGKSDAVNRIIQSMKGLHLILINGDALPDAGAISNMMEYMVDGKNAVICALPVPAETRCGATVRHISSFLWSLHNTTMETLSRNGQQIHLTDEMIGLNSQALLPLPEGTVNDGAYIAARAQHYGQRVDYCSKARVFVSVPSNLRGLYRQRRRILFGHMLVRDMTGSSPGTFEFSFLRRPLLCLRIITRTIVSCPEGLPVMPWILSIELLAMMGAFADRKSREHKHTVWTRVKNAAWR